jgi:hypothetical protein
MDMKKIGKLTNMILNIFAVLLIITGLGITQSRFMESITFGFLDKLTSFRLHSAFWIPFTLALLVRFYLNFKRKRKIG